MTTMESRQYKVGVTSHICHPVYTMYMSFASRHFLNSCKCHEGRKKLTSREKDLFSCACNIYVHPVRLNRAFIFRL